MAAVDRRTPARNIVSSPDVIDVDLLDDDIGAAAGMSRPHMHRRPHSMPYAPIRNTSAGAGPSTAIVVDGDDEQLFPVYASAVPSAHRTRFFSPPPPVRHERLPPVPPLPRHLAGQGSYPVRRDAVVPPPPVIIPNAQPLPFEQHFQPAPRQGSPPVVNLPAAARSHHQPVMGLGGALIAHHRQEALERRRQQFQEVRQRGTTRSRSSMLSFIGNITRHFTGNAQPDAQPDALPPPRPFHWWARLLDGEDGDYFEAHPEAAENFGLFGPFDWLPFQRPQEATADVRPSVVTPAVWKPAYTHPDKMLPGFTSGFSVDTSASDGSSVIVLDDDSGSSGKSKTSKTGPQSPVDITTTLVCARCLTPLVLSGDDSLLSAEAQRDHRVWALRCGHMLDGKCIRELLHPPETPKVEEHTKAPGQDVKGKGKARVANPDGPTGRSIDSAVIDQKGKRRRLCGHLTADANPEETLSVESLTLPPIPSIVEMADSIRSRLRPRRPRQDPSSDSMTQNSSESSRSGRTIRPLPRRQAMSALPSVETLLAPPSPKKSKGKGKARVPRQPKVEAYFEWNCPVVGCERRHLSMCIGGEWKMDPNEGAISLFL